MVRGLYTAYTGMINQQKRLDTISNNLANSATIGFKREGATAQAFKEVLAIKVKDASESYVSRGIGNMSLGVKIGENYTDYAQGSFRETGNSFDVALEGDGFFSISFMNKRGEESTKYSRDGSFTMDLYGDLRTKDGDYVLGEGGIITLPTDSTRISINSLGEIHADDVFIDRLALVDFEDYDHLKKYGENMYDALPTAVEKEALALTRQGYLEMSNVNVIKEMVEMITITRAYEANQKALQSVDSTMEHSANSIGRV